MGSSSAAPWKQLLIGSIQANSHLKHYSYFQLDESDRILINTDTRSRKIDDLKHCPFAEICWYFTESWEQFRISGPVDVIDGMNPDPVKLQQREKSWFACSLRSRMQYMAPTPRVSVYEQPSQTQTPSLDPSIGPVGAFCLLVLDPDQVDYLNLKTNERLIFTSGLGVDALSSSHLAASQPPSPTVPSASVSLSLTSHNLPHTVACSPPSGPGPPHAVARHRSWFCLHVVFLTSNDH
ncbi:hypothetical protein DH2020_023014 [Rehmannia glutinosa]|uniref:pyridoxal 5'-phosphate synthase n=1 Tax=Rehmannia glutinosa TaxID=99300 RepID=A0ABR0W7Q4_REHGL